MINTPYVITVGPGKMFTTIQPALNFIQNKLISGDIKIKVDDGTYNVSSLWVGHCPQSAHITIEGNLTNPSACVIAFQPDSNKTSHGWIFDNVSGIKIGGFKLVGDMSATNTTMHGILSSNTANIDIISGSMIIENCWVGLYASRGSRIYTSNVSINNCCHGAYAMDCSVIEMVGSTVSTNSKSFTNYLAKTDVVNVSVVSESRGITAVDGSNIYCALSTITGFAKGVLSSARGYLWADCVTIKEAYYPMHAERNSIIWSHKKDVAGVPKGSSFINCRQVFTVDSNSYLFCNSATFSNVSEWICYCDTNATVILYDPSGTSVNGFQANNNGVIQVTNHSTSVTTVGTRFVPAVNTIGTSGGYINSN